LNLNQNNVGDGDQINNIELEQAINDFTDALNQTIDENEKELEAEMNQAMENAKELNDNLKDMFGGYSKSGNNELLKIPLEQRLELAELLRKNTKMKEIADWAG